jgi:hypothetical protein
MSRSTPPPSAVDDLIGDGKAVEPPGVMARIPKAERLEEFLRQLAQGQTVRSAAASVAIDLSTLYKERRNDPVLAKKWEEAIAISIPQLEKEAFRRAMHTSDKLLMFVLERRAPHLYGAKQAIDVTSSDGSMSPAQPSDSERVAKVEALMALAKARKTSTVDDLL